MSYGFRHQSDKLAHQSQRRRFWRQFGYRDGATRRRAATETTLRNLGGELALHAYRAGYASGERERLERSA